MKALKIILGGLVGLFIILVVIGFILPNTAHVERSVEVNVPQAEAFAMLNNYKRFNEWSPWHKIDPKTKYTHSGPDSGVGAKMMWESDHPHVMTGSQEITKIDGQKYIEVFLDFGPQGTATSYYELESSGSGTKITWGFDSEFGNDIFGRYFGLLYDSMIGPSYEEGLSDLKKVLEK